MLDDVADVPVATDASGPRSPDRAALRYLEMSGVNAISITDGPGGAVIAVGFKVDAVTAYWLPADKARSVAARARKLLSANASSLSTGDSQGVATVDAALKEAAAQLRVTLTGHDIVMARAHAAAKRLDVLMSSMRGTGLLKEFNRAFKRRREAAAERGEGFMSFAVAELRLKRALIPLLQNGGKPAIGASLFATVFDS